MKVQLDMFQHSGNIAEVKPTYKTNGQVCENPKITEAETSVQVLRSIWDNDRMEYAEDFVILLLNRANYVLGWVKVSQGGVGGTIADPKVIFSIALQTNASGIILCHNHPSGNLLPSPEDRKLTNRLVEVGKLLEIGVLDHIILTVNGFTSFANEGLMPY